MLISREDRNLLVRVGKHLREALEAEERAAAPGSAGPLRDRLLRDERDLQALRRRLEVSAAPAAGAREDAIERALRQLLAAEHEFERDTGMKVNDLVAERVREAELVLRGGG